MISEQRGRVFNFSSSWQVNTKDIASFLLTQCGVEYNINLLPINQSYRFVSYALIGWFILVTHLAGILLDVFAEYEPSLHEINIIYYIYEISQNSTIL